jgi:GNAT superfamily N-acetyltransferase
VPTALARVRAFAAAHDVPARVLTPTGSPWSRAVAAEGWVPDAGPEAGAEGAVLVLDLEPLARPDGPGAASLAAEPDDAWWAMTVGGAPTPVQRHVLAGPGPVLGFGSARGPDCEPVGALRTAVVGDHLHLSRLTVTEPEPARRNDTATALTTAAARWGRDRGARWAVLQVALVDADTRGFYEGLGAVEHHRYHYLVRG